jgi:hypothetical protein
MPAYPFDLRTRHRAHEAVELANLAVQICRIHHTFGKDNTPAEPEAYLEEALDLILAAGRAIDRKELELYKQKNE